MNGCLIPCLESTSSKKNGKVFWQIARRLGRQRGVYVPHSATLMLFLNFNHKFYHMCFPPPFTGTIPLFRILSIPSFYFHSSRTAKFYISSSLRYHPYLSFYSSLGHAYSMCIHDDRGSRCVLKGWRMQVEIYKIIYI